MCGRSKKAVERETTRNLKKGLTGHERDTVKRMLGVHLSNAYPRLAA